MIRRPAGHASESDIQINLVTKFNRFVENAVFANSAQPSVPAVDRDDILTLI
jgi:hypothetical protein